jgi:hypothetical protein
MKNILILGLISFIYLTSCNKNQNEINPNDIATSTVMSSLEDFNNISNNRELASSIAKGDTIAYKKLKEIYFDSGHAMDFLKYSIIMANNFNYPESCYDSYQLLKNEYINENNKMTNKLANFYLLRSYEMGIEEAKSNVKKRFKSHTKLPKSKDYWLEVIK